MIQQFNAKNAPDAIGPYSHATIANGVIYTSGQIALDPESNELVSGGVDVQCDRVMRNLEAILNEAGSDWNHVLKMNIFLADMNDFPTVNEIYASFLGGHKPARSTVEVSKLPKGVAIEIDCIAQVKS